MSEFKYYRKKQLAEMRPYIPGESLDGITVAAEDIPPQEGDYIARNPTNYMDQWLVSKEFVEGNYVEIV